MKRFMVIIGVLVYAMCISGCGSKGIKAPKASEQYAGMAWKTVYEEEGNFLRLRKVSFEPVEADALRLVVTSTWGSEKGHVFAFDAL